MLWLHVHTGESLQTYGRLRSRSLVSMRRALLPDAVCDSGLLDDRFPFYSA